MISQFLKTKSWEKAAEKLEKFWTKQLSLKCLDIKEISKPWYEQWVKRNPTVASEEESRRYYSVKKLLSGESLNNMYYNCKSINDSKFFDPFLLSTWLLHGLKTITRKYREVC